MRIRTIKPEFFLHEGLWQLEHETGLPVRLAFIGLWCAADRSGRFRWEPRRLKVQILPYDDTDFSRVLHALTTRDFVLKYASKEGEIGFIPGFQKHQIVNNREKPSELPEPSLDKASDACPTRDARVPHACRKEGKGREGNKYISPVGDIDGGFALNGEEVPTPARKDETDPVALRLFPFFNRRATTRLNDKERPALRKAAIQPDDLLAVEAYYTAEIPEKSDYRRRSLLTLVNNWTGEVDRARKWAKRNPTTDPNAPQEKDELQIRLSKLFGRDPEANWTGEEISAYQAVLAVEVTEDDTRRLESYYVVRNDSKLNDFNRPASLLGLLRKFSETCDAARRYRPPTAL